MVSGSYSMPSNNLATASPANAMVWPIPANSSSRTDARPLPIAKAARPSVMIVPFIVFPLKDCERFKGLKPLSPPY